MAEENDVNNQESEKANKENETIVDENTQETIVEEKKEETPEEKYAELNDRFLRLYAEFDNFRKRTNKDGIHFDF